MKEKSVRVGTIVLKALPINMNFLALLELTILGRGNKAYAIASPVIQVCSIKVVI